MAIWLIIVRGSYRSAERIFIWFTIPFFAYPIAAILAHPDWAEVGKAIVTPTIHTNSAYLLLLIATAGTTITPYMQLYLQSAVVERGVREDELGHEEREAVARRGLRERDRRLHHHRHRRDAVHARHPRNQLGGRRRHARSSPSPGSYAEVLFGIGLLGASLLAAAILPIATSYVVSESLGYEKGVGRRREEAPVFVGDHHRDDRDRAIVAVIPGVPVISLLVGVQVVNGLLLPINLFFIWRLSRSAPRDGRAPQWQRPRRRHGDHGRRDLHALGRSSWSSPSAGF